MEENSPEEVTTYYFASYGDDQGTELLAKGTVQETGVTSEGYIQIEVLTNEPDETWIGQKFYVADTAQADGTTLYPIYTDAGTTSTGMYVKISETDNL